MSTKQDTNVNEQEEADELQENEEDTSIKDTTDSLIEVQQKRIEELEEELEKVKDTQLRKAAEMENMRKRLQREREQIFESARFSALEAFLPVNDDLIRTLHALKESEANNSFIEGIELVKTKFEQVLEKYDVERIDQAGVPFDVDLHDAMLRQKADDESIDSGTVLQVLENGYKMGDKTIRHAKVIVSE